MSRDGCSAADAVQGRSTKGAHLGRIFAPGIVEDGKLFRRVGVGDQFGDAGVGDWVVVRWHRCQSSRTAITAGHRPRASSKYTRFQTLCDLLEAGCVCRQRNRRATASIPVCCMGTSPSQYTIEVARKGDRKLVVVRL